MKNLTQTLILTGSILLITALTSGIGYGLYLWGVVELSLGLAAFKGFIVWLSFIVLGVVSFAGAFVAHVANESKKFKK